MRWPACSFSHASQPCPRFPKDLKFYAIKVSSLLLHALERYWSLKDYTNTHPHSLLLTCKIFESEFTSSGNVQLFKQAHYYCQKPHSLDGRLECTYTCACTHTAQGGSRLTAASAQSSVIFVIYYYIIFHMDNYKPPLAPPFILYVCVYMNIPTIKNKGSLIAPQLLWPMPRASMDPRRHWPQG